MMVRAADNAMVHPLLVVWTFRFKGALQQTHQHQEGQHPNKLSALK